LIGKSRGKGAIAVHILLGPSACLAADRVSGAVLVVEVVEGADWVAVVEEGCLWVAVRAVVEGAHCTVVGA
jgi:hypothetical protein